MRLLIATDAWHPQINGVARTYEELLPCLLAQGIDTRFVTPSHFKTLPCPTYPEIRLAVPGSVSVDRLVRSIGPDAIHVATEGPVGWLVRRWCIKNRFAFTTAFHTRFPEYIHSRSRLPMSWSYAWLRRFHNRGAGMMVASPTLATELTSLGFDHVLPWAKGIDAGRFKPSGVRLFGEAPVFLYVGRVAVEKNLPAFLSLDLPGRKVVVGSGPMLDDLRARHPDVLFTGHKTGQELADCFASGDVFVFPSQTDTFGIVLLEAMATGIPIAAFPVVGPRDVITQGVTGVLDPDLRQACLAALALDRSKIREHALAFTWARAARQFVKNIETAYARAGRPLRREMAAAGAFSGPADRGD